MDSREKIKTVLLKEQKADFSKMELNETIKWLGQYCIHMAKIIEMLKQYKGLSNVDYLTDETFRRYKGLALSLSFPIENFRRYVPVGEQFENPKEEINSVEQGLLIQSWSSLGSLLESTLQMFLAFYHEDFLKSNWGKWDEKTIRQLEESLVVFNDKLKQVVTSNQVSDDGGLNGKRRKRFLEKVQQLIQEKAVMPKLADITLSNLIDFYFSEEVIYNGSIYEKKELQKIRDYRNAIHSFKDRSIGTWNDLMNIQN
ncbi:hypothetical protein [Peribacillus sp. NPDC058075]|uniref:hypothetical protein n=1 Tax=unclassified Peribacillus TaxID=2675266 RepID=UPI0036DEF3EC